LKRRGKLALFLGNEYGAMQEKIQFAKDVRADFVASQLPAETAQWLYADCPASTILALPAGLNPGYYCPKAGPRPIDLGFRGAKYDLTIGDQDRAQLVETLKQKGRDQGLTCDISYSQLSRAQWAAFLQSSRGTVGAESGTNYLEKDGHLQNQVHAFLKSHPAATFDDVYTRFFQFCKSPLSGKAISSRHFEAIGTQTCQVLLEGQYNGILIEGKHYIGVKKDYSNADDALAQLRDETIRQRIVRDAYDYVMSKHTYTHRVQHLIDHVLAAATPNTPRTYNCQGTAGCTPLMP
jgi:hypothetical protein